MEKIVGEGKIELPDKLKEFMKGNKQSKLLNAEYQVFKKYILENVE
ncbi:MAG: hypothetical protein L3J54_10400 [Draconibacterium sp.]|nr:hypothetical protein [Draconibacterium sp.]